MTPRKKTIKPTHRLRFAAALLIAIPATLGCGRTLASVEASAPTPHTVATTNQASNVEVEMDLITAGSTIAGAIVGGFFVWLAGVRIAARRERYDDRTVRQSLILDYENSVLEFALAVAHEIDAVSDATRIEAEIKTDVTTSHVMIRAQKIRAVLHRTSTSPDPRPARAGRHGRLRDLRMSCVLAKEQMITTKTMILLLHSRSAL